MIDQLEAIDRAIVLAINGFHTPFFDTFFWIISARITWIPLYLLLIYLSWKHFGTKKSLQFIVIVVGTIAIADLTSVYFFKEVFQRYRPSHHTLLTERLHFHFFTTGEIYKGGMYGFVSSHAVNFMVITTLIGLSLRSRYPKLICCLLAITLLVAYSRMYLGVHYLSDVCVGALWGFILGWLSWHFLVKRIVLSDKEISN